MKILAFSLLAIFIFSTNAVFAQNVSMDWKDLFPEISGCKRTVQPLTQNGENFEQTAVYQPRISGDVKTLIYYGCGSITLRVAPSAKKTARGNYSNQFPTMFFRKQKVKNFDAYLSSPRCGNDDWGGTIYVYFDEDKVLIVSAKRGIGNILDFAENADYEQTKKSLDKFTQKK